MAKSKKVATEALDLLTGELVKIKPKPNLRLVRKGTKVTRETVVCEQCGNDFDRAIVHHYIKTCKDCRGTSKKAKTKKAKFSRFGCVECRTLLETGRLKKGCIYMCPFCEHNWVVIGNGWYREESNGENKVFYLDTLVGLIEHHGDFRRLVNEHPEYPRP